jgi:menaquinol-cytochrome c reductase iron-sulfur subunit
LTAAEGDTYPPDEGSMQDYGSMIFGDSEHEGRGEEEAVQPGAQVSMPMITRRRLLGYLSGLFSGVIAAALGIPLARFYVGNAFKPRKPRWFKLAPAAEVRVGQPSLFTVSYVDQDGWRETTTREELYAVTQNGQDYVVLSNVCTHLGCPIRWDDAKRGFLCPCHGGVFSIDGGVVQGPAPEPLTRVTHKIEGGVIYVQVGEA